MSTQAPAYSSQNVSTRQIIVDKIRRMGGAATDALLDPSGKYFTLSDIDGLIGYRIEKGIFIAFGDPVCLPENRSMLVTSFHQYAKDQGFDVIYMTASEEFAKWAMDNVCKVLIRFGDEFTIDPHNDPRNHTGTRGSLVRRKTKHATKEGVHIKEYHTHDERLELSLEEVGKQWLEARRGPQIHISNVRLFDDRFGKRWFYAQKDERIVGTVTINKLEKHQGWLLNHVMFTPDAPHGTPELLVVAVLETLANEGCHYVTFGSSPSSELKEIVGLNPFSASIAKLTFKAINKLFHLDGHKVFWDKFHPESQGSFLLFTSTSIGLKEILALKNALNVTV